MTDLDGGGGPGAPEVERDDVLGGVAVGEVAARLRQDDGGLSELPADPAEAPLAQVAVGIVAAAVLLAVLLRLLLSQLVSAFQLHFGRRRNFGSLSKLDLEQRLMEAGGAWMDALLLY